MRLLRTNNDLPSAALQVLICASASVRWAARPEMKGVDSCTLWPVQTPDAVENQPVLPPWMEAVGPVVALLQMRYTLGTATHRRMKKRKMRPGRGETL